MGSNLGPTMAAFIMDKVENQMPSTPKFYCRYVDDVLAIFDEPKEAEDFLHFINSINDNIQFTKEDEENKSLIFLDIELNCENNKIITKWHMKSTNTGQYLHKHAFAPQNYKYAAIKSLIYRAYRLTTKPSDFEAALISIRNVFVNLGYHYKIVEQIRDKIIDKFNYRNNNNENDANKKTIYFCLPFVKKFEIVNKRMMSNINSMIGPDIHARMAYSTHKSQSFFSNKDKISTGLRSNLVYKYSCEHDCDRIYVGETCRHLATRIKEHLNGKPVASEITLHEHAKTNGNFKILMKTKYPLIAEALFYHTIPPGQRLNKYQPPFQLQLFNFSDPNPTEEGN